MLRALPYRRVVAETAAWPFWSEVAFALRTTQLARVRTGILTADTASLASELENYLLPRARGLSVEVLAQVRSKTWFGEALDGETLATEPSLRQPGRTTIPLHEHLVDLAVEHLQLGDRVRLREGRQPIERVAERWRALSLALPADLLVAALVAHESRGTVRLEPPGDSVSILTPLLERLLSDAPLAETHLHHGAAVPFEFLWTHLMIRMADGGPDPKDLAQHPPTPFGGGRRFRAWLATAALVRYALARFLYARSTTSVRTLGAFLSSFLGERPETGHDYATALIRLRAGREPLAAARAVAAYRARVPPRPRVFKAAAELHTADPIARTLGVAHAALPETRFLTRSIAYLMGEGQGQEPIDPDFAVLFWQYVRIRCRTYRHLTIEPGTAGLDWFTRYFGRISALRQGMSDEFRVSAALDLESRGAFLGSLEVRTAPPREWAKVIEAVRSVDEARQPARLPKDRSPERGLVLHFVKERERRAGRQRWLIADPRQGARYAAYFRERSYEARAIAKAIERWPPILRWLRGLDMCNLELAVPTWVLLPLLASVRSTSDRVASQLGGELKPLRLTLHAGEDFRSLMEGLRRIHEPIEFQLLRVGDRLGHAVALGTDVDDWAAVMAHVAQPAEERLDDLLWELARYREGDMVPVPGRVEKVRAEIERRARFIYGEGTPCTVENLLTARAWRHRPAVLAGIDYPWFRLRQTPPRTEEHRLLLAYLRDTEVFVRGQMAVEVLIDESERRTLAIAQEMVRRHCARLGLTVEANPSSNLLIGDLSLDEHPAFRLLPLPGREAGAGGPVAVALGDDDPLTFAASLPEEFAYLYYALVRRGVAARDAEAWLEGVRRNAWTARFTVPESRQATTPRRLETEHR